MDSRHRRGCHSNRCFIRTVSWSVRCDGCKAAGSHCATEPRALLRRRRGLAGLHPRGAVGLGTPKEQETPTVPERELRRCPAGDAGPRRARGAVLRRIPSRSRRSAPSSALSGGGRRRLPKRRATRMRGVAAGPGDGGGGGRRGRGRGGGRGRGPGAGRGRDGRAGPRRGRGGAATAAGAAAGAAGRRGARLPGELPGARGRGQAPLPQAVPAPGAGGAAQPAAHGAGGAIPAALPAGRWALPGGAGAAVPGGNASGRLPSACSRRPVR